MEIGSVIREKRTAQGLTQEQVATADVYKRQPQRRVGAGDHQLRLSAALEEKSLTPAPGGAEPESRWLSGFFS